MLFLSLKDKKNPSLRTRVIQGEISPARLSTMESHEMASAERKAEDEEIQKENTRKAMVAKPEKSISDQLQCGKCGQKKVSYTQAQTRSADEPMTTVCYPLSPGNLKLRIGPITNMLSSVPAKTAEIYGSSHNFRRFTYCLIEREKHARLVC